MNYLFCALLLAVVAGAAAQAEDYPPPFKIEPQLAPLRDKTLVVWCTPSNTTQRGGGVFSLERSGQFDAIVLGEIAAGKWMTGSDGFARTAQDQAAWPVESAGPGETVQLAAVYCDRTVTLYRNGTPLHTSTIAAPAEFGPMSQVLFGLRHEALRGGGNGFFAGTVDEARLYNTALDAAQIQALHPGERGTPAPLALWTFEDGSTADAMGTFAPGELFGGATVSGGKLHLDGQDDFMMTPAGVRFESDLHFRPASGVLGDAIPFFWKGTYHVFYLKGPSWGHLASQDLVHWKELPDALAPGQDSAGPDSECCWTGSVIEHQGRFHLFYTGKNLRDPLGDQKVMHAVSDDLVVWTKRPELTFYADGKNYWSKPVNGPVDDRMIYHHQAFRDPLVIWNGAQGKWWMLLHALQADGAMPVFALYDSDDLEHWAPRPPLYRYPAAVSGDCPDIFEADGKWYIIAANHHATRADAIGGPYAPEMVPFEAGDLTVPKTMFDGQRRILVGWLNDYAGFRDEGNGVWGGCLSMARELYPDAQGRLRQRPAHEVVAAFNRQVLSRPEGPASGERLTLPRDFMLQATLQAVAPGAKATFALRQPQARPAGGYRLSVDFATRKIALSGSHHTAEETCDFDPAAPLSVRLFAVGTVIECFVNDAYAFTIRAFDDWGAGLSVEAAPGQVQVRNLNVNVMP